MTSFGENLAALAGMAGLGAEGRERVLAADAFSHHIADKSPVCGIGPMDWTHGSRDWHKVTCPACLKIQTLVDSGLTEDEAKNQLLQNEGKHDQD